MRFVDMWNALEDFWIEILSSPWGGCVFPWGPWWDFGG